LPRKKPSEGWSSWPIVNRFSGLNIVMRFDTALFLHGPLGTVYGNENRSLGSIGHVHSKRSATLCYLFTHIAWRKELDFLSKHKIEMNRLQ